MCSSNKTIPLLYFSVSLKFGSCYIMGQWCEFRINNTKLCFHLLCLFVCFLFLIIKFVILLFSISSFPFHSPLASQRQELLVRNCSGTVCYLLSTYSLDPLEKFGLIKRIISQLINILTLRLKTFSGVIWHV